MQADSGYSGLSSPLEGYPNVDGTPVRDMESWDQTDGTTIIDRPTNRFPRERLQLLNYVPHSTTANKLGNYISLVDAALNGGDPCVLGEFAAAGRWSPRPEPKPASASLY